MIITKDNKSMKVDSDPAALFLAISGGGLNELQTIKAMTLLEHYNREGSVKYKGFTYKQDEAAK